MEGSTEEVFKKIVSESKWYVNLGYTESNAKSIAKRFRDGKLTLDKIEEVIKKAGYSVKQEKLWQR